SPVAILRDRRCPVKRCPGTRAAVETGCPHFDIEGRSTGAERLQPAVNRDETQMARLLRISRINGSVDPRQGGRFDMDTQKTVAARIGNLDLDEAFAEAEVRSLAGRACEIWCQRDGSGKPVTYRVVTHREGRTTPEPWEPVALFPAVGT